jgi:hypothetical protein
MAFFALPAARAQSYHGSLTFQKNQYAVASVVVPFDDNVVTAAIKDYMSGKGYKDSRYKDFVVFRSVPIDPNDNVLFDAYFSINRKSRSEKDLTVVNLLPVKKGETLLPANVEDSSFISRAMVYMNGLKPIILTYSVQQEILAQQEKLARIQTRMLHLKNDSGDIAKKIRGYHGDLADNKNDQDKQSLELKAIPSGDAASLAKAQKKMDKLMDKQADYEKRLRNAMADAEKNRKDREDQQILFNKESPALDALRLKQQNLAVNP